MPSLQHLPFPAPSLASPRGAQGWVPPRGGCGFLHGTSGAQVVAEHWGVGDLELPRAAPGQRYYLEVMMLLNTARGPLRLHEAPKEPGRAHPTP